MLHQNGEILGETYVNLPFMVPVSCYNLTIIVHFAFQNQSYGASPHPISSKEPSSIKHLRSLAVNFFLVLFHTLPSTQMGKSKFYRLILVF
jgi:hypothetical protein